MGTLGGLNWTQQVIFAPCQSPALEFPLAKLELRPLRSQAPEAVKVL